MEAQRTAAPPAPAKNTTQAPSQPSSDLDAAVADLRARQATELARQPEPKRLDMSRLPEIVLTPEEDARRIRERNEAKESRERGERRAAWEKFVKARGRRYEDCRFGNYRCDCDDQRAALKRVMDYAENAGENIRRGRNVVLFGPPGTGKDHLVSALCHQAIYQHGSRIAWISCLDMYAEMRDAMTDGVRESEVLKRYTRTDVLAISDILPPFGSASEYQAATLSRLIDRRYSEMRPTWATLNAANGREAEERTGHAVIDRLRHDALVVNCSWESYRRAGK